MKPTIDKLLLQAVEAHKLGKLQDAERLYRSILQVQPKHADANHNLGVLAVGLGKPAMALPLLKAAIEANQRQEQFWISYINALIEVKQFAEAKSSLDEGKRQGLAGDAVTQLERKLTGLPMKQEPFQQEITAFLFEYNAGNFELAEQLAKALTQKSPSHSFGWKVLGAITQQTGRLQDSLASMKQAIRLAPNDPETHSNLGNALQELRRLTEAEASYREALRLKSDYAQAHNNLGNVLKGLGRFTEAEASYREALRLKRDYVEAHYNLGFTLNLLERLTEAETSYREAIRLKPDLAKAHNNLGIALKDFGRLTEAEASYREALRLKPDYARAYANLGNILKDLGRISEAERSYREAIRLKPDYAEAHSNLLFSLNYVESLSTEAALMEAKRYGSAVSFRAVPKFTSWETPRDVTKLRIGFVSGDFRNHPVGYFIEGLIKHLDQDQFELVAFPTTPKTNELTIRIKPHFHEWIPIFGKSDLEAATLIHQKGIQVLIDLSGHTAHNRLPVFAYKPAPVQLTWLGYCGTTGVQEIDYLLGDAYATPVEEENHFVETIWRMPESYICLTPPQQEVQIDVLPAQRNGYVTFGSFNNLSKMTDAVVSLWARILSCVEHSRLFLKTKQFNDERTVQDTIERFRKCGIQADRLIIEGTTPSHIAHLKAYNRVDIALDTFPYNGVTTSAEALWMGVPVITKKGKRFIAHNGESIAHNAGQANWIAEDLDDYVRKAKLFAADLEALAKTRSGLRAQVLTSPLFDSRRFARNFEEAMTAMYYKAATRRGPFTRC